MRHQRAVRVARALPLAPAAGRRASAQITWLIAFCDGRLPRQGVNVVLAGRNDTSTTIIPQCRGLELKLKLGFDMLCICHYQVITLCGPQSSQVNIRIPADPTICILAAHLTSQYKSQTFARIGILILVPTFHSHDYTRLQRRSYKAELGDEQEAFVGTISEFFLVLSTQHGVVLIS
jgi:hypothetical protein